MFGRAIQLSRFVGSKPPMVSGVLDKNDNWAQGRLTEARRLEPRRVLHGSGSTCFHKSSFSL